jgi:heterotetrameric sarcosine oxidase gamma subunit
LREQLTPLSSFTSFPATAPAGRGVVVTDRDGVGIAVVLVRQGKTAALVQRMREHFGIDLPLGPRCARRPNIAISGIRPGGWLATCDQAGNAFAAHLRETVADLACVSDQSDGYALLRLTGPMVRDALTKLFPIDLHSRAFQPGDVAATLAAHIAITVWRMADASDGCSVFEIAVPRSFAGSFAHALRDSAAEFGLCVGSPQVSVAMKIARMTTGHR